MIKNSKAFPHKKANMGIKIGRIFFPILIYYLVNQVVVGVGVSVLQMIKGGVGDSVSFLELQSENILAVTLIQGLGMLIACAVVFRDFKEEVSSVIEKSISVKRWIFLSIFGISSAMVCNIIFSLTGLTGSSVNYEEVAQAQFALPLWLGLLLYGVIAPFAEEWIFRGIVFNRMKTYFGITSAVIGSAIIFGVFHGNYVQAIYGALIGMLLAWSYQRYHSFIVPLVLHGVINATVYTVSTIPELNEVIFQLNSCVVFLLVGVGSLFIMLRDIKRESV
ncbi:MAG: type II CAAX endopeptidase family protein [Eubacteriales bacterium]